jgi:hypothetical protein
MSIAIVDCLAKIRERVLASPFSFNLAREFEQERRLTNQVESDIRERDVLLENGTMPAPLRKTMTEHETIVAESEEIFGESGVVAQKPFSPRGIL